MAPHVSWSAARIARSSQMDISNRSSDLLFHVGTAKYVRFEKKKLKTQKKQTRHWQRRMQSGRIFFWGGGERDLCIFFYELPWNDVDWETKIIEIRETRRRGQDGDSMKGFFSKVLSHEKICWAGYHNTIVLGDCFPPSLPFVTKQEANRKLLYSNRDC